MNLSPIEKFIIDNLKNRGRVSEQQLKELLKESTGSPIRSQSVVDVLVEKGFLDIEERKQLRQRFLDMQQALDSKQTHEQDSRPADEEEISAPDVLEGIPEDDSAQFDKTTVRHVRTDLAATINIDPSEMDLGDAPMQETLPESDDRRNKELQDTLGGHEADDPSELEKTAPGISQEVKAPEGLDLDKTFQIDEDLDQPGTAEKPSGLELDTTFQMDPDLDLAGASPVQKAKPEGLNLDATFQADADASPGASGASQTAKPEGLDLDVTFQADAEDLPSASSSRDTDATIMDGPPPDLEPDLESLKGRAELELGTTKEPEIASAQPVMQPDDLSDAPTIQGDERTLKDVFEPDNDMVKTQIEDSELDATAPASTVGSAPLDDNAPVPSVAEQTEVDFVEREDATSEPFADQASASQSVASSSQLRMLTSGLTSGRLDLSKFLTEEEIQRVMNQQEGETFEYDSLVGQVLGGHVVIDKIGEGGMGEVYLAKQLSLGRYVALKVLPPHAAHDQRFVDQFVYEANLLAKITHTNIVQIYDVQFTNDGKLFFTMENIKGHSLKQMIVEQEQLPVDAAINIVKQCCRALSRVKQDGITHRDIKPGNILLDDQGVVKVVDFGLADYTQELAARDKGHAAGTPYYMPPEALRNEPATHFSDQYSLGATFHHMLTGKPPFEAQDLPALVEKHLNDAPPLASSANTLVPAMLDKILQRMLAKKSEDRFPNFKAIYEELEKVEAKMGFRVTDEQFLAEKLVDLSSKNITKLKRNIALWGGVGLGSAVMAFSLNALAWETLTAPDAYHLKQLAGSWGTYLVTVAYIIILYIGAVRKKLVAPMGSIRLWLQIHMFLAFVGSMLLVYHSGNIFRDYIALSPLDRRLVSPVALLPLANTLVLMFIVMSGLIGRFIYNDLNRQLNLEKMAARARDEDDAKLLTPHAMTMLAVSHRMLSYWRILHYPLTIIFFILTALHIVTILAYGGSVIPVHPDTPLIEMLR